jgi:hypothetical protein
VARPIAWALTIWGAALYLLAGLFYVIQVVGLVRAERAGRPLLAGAADAGR